LRPELSVVIPVFNERATLLELLERVAAVPVDKEIIVVDDGSTDGTRELLASQVEGRERIKVLYHPANQGKGAAIRTGLEAVSGRAVIIQDADLEYEPQDFLKLLAVFDPERRPVVYGSRILGQRQGRTEGRPIKAYYMGGRLVSLAASLIFGVWITDEPTCYKLFASDLIKRTPLSCRGFEFCPEITAKVIRQGFRIEEVPISYRPRSLGEGKKIRWQDGLEAIWTLLRYRFWRPPRDREP